jgi:hypothetical protein
VLKQASHAVETASRAERQASHEQRRLPYPARLKNRLKAFVRQLYAVPLVHLLAFLGRSGNFPITPFIMDTHGNGKSFKKNKKSFTA